MRILYYCPFGTGGLAAYSHEQANALCDAGCDITMVTSEDYPDHANARYSTARIFPARSSSVRLPRWLRRLGTGWQLLKSQFRLAQFASQRKFERVLMGSYIEYLAPMWAWRFRQLAKRGTVFGAIVHDPVRDYVVGPSWWHRRSIAAGYSYIREAFVHAPIQLDTSRPMPQLRTTVIPQGPYVYSTAKCSRAAMRASFDLPLDVPVGLAFGHLRDGKNLHLFLEAMSDFPNLHLIVAGKEQTTRELAGSHYQKLAVRYGLVDRCRWLLGYVPDEEVGGLFEAADFTLLTYSRNFRSASAVLNTAVAFRRPCLVSGGEGNMKQVVREYELGVWIEPDDVDEIRKGLKQLLENPVTPRWDDYERQHSWQENAARVVNRLT